jgi:hypothetical protein
MACPQWNGHSPLQIDARKALSAPLHRSPTSSSLPAANAGIGFMSKAVSLQESTRYCAATAASVPAWLKPYIMNIVTVLCFYGSQYCN